MSEILHSPLPWKGEGDSIIVSSFEPGKEGDLVVGAIAEVRRTFAETPKPLDDRRRRANRDLILRAVNAHDALLAAVRASDAIRNGRSEEKERIVRHAGYETLNDLIAAALAKAGGGA